MLQQNEQIQKDLLAVMNQRQHQYKGFLFQGVIAQSQEKEWKNCVTQITALDHSEYNEITLKYRQYIYFEEIKTKEFFLSLLDSLLNTGTIELHGFAVRLVSEPILKDCVIFRYNRFLSTQESSTYLKVNWPSNYYYCQGDIVMNPTYDGLTELNNPIYPSGYKLIEHRMGIDLVKHNGLAGSVNILLPNYQARIVEVVISTKTIKVEIESKQALCNDLILKTYARNEDTTVHLESECVNREHLIDLGVSPLELQICLFDKQTAELLDERVFDSGNIKTQMPFEITPEYVKFLAKSGENVHVEFKEIGSGDKQKEEWAETAISFANTEGGLILIGIGDHGEIIGAGNTSEESIFQSIIDRCEPPIEIKIHKVNIDNKPIFVVNVQEILDKPCIHKNKGIAYLRKGSTDRPATRFELDDFYVKDDEEFSIAN
jgi:hypothetical protein